MEGVSDTLEDFRLYCLSFWSDYYLIYSKLNYESVAEASSRSWLLFTRQPTVVQAFVSVAVLVAVAMAIIRTYTKLTTRRCTSTARLDGRTAIVTGANSGIGLETARDLASRGARVILACRNMSKGVEACKEIARTTGSEELEVRRLDLSCMRTVRDFARDVLDGERRLDVLVLNAGVALTKKYMTEDGLELHMASNHFGHFLLANLLAPLMVKTAAGRDRSDPVRLVTVSSLAHWWGNVELDNLNSERYYDAERIYGTTKLVNLLMAKEFARRLKPHNVTSNAVHPGAVQTDLFRNIPYVGALIHTIMGMIYKSPRDGAQTSIHVAVSEEAAAATGEYFVECRPHTYLARADDENLARGVWGRSEEILRTKVDDLMLF